MLRDAGEGRKGVLLVIHNVTDLKRLESIRRDFVANVSHELKTPVTSIQGYVETLLDGAMDDALQREKFLKIVAKHTERLHAILEDLLMLARVEQEGKNPRHCSPTEGCGRARSGRCRLRREGRGKEHAGPVICPAELAVAMNASLLEQAVVNLVENAIAYSPPGQTVEVSGLAGEREIEIRVRDYGCGISASTCRGSSNASTASTSRGAGRPAAPAWGWPSSSTSCNSTAAAPRSPAFRARAARSPFSCRSNARV